MKEVSPLSIFARSDLAAVTISEAHGGCGKTHSRPAPGGKPAAIWELSCPLGCEEHLRHDPLWATTPAEIPETYDETKIREDFEKRGAKDKDAVLTLALARLAGIPAAELPDSLTRMISGAPMHVPGLIECPNGHAQASGLKFCGECGTPMHGTPPERQLPAAQQPPAATKTPAAGNGGGARRRLRDARLDEMQALARMRGLDADGNRSELLARLSAAGVTSNDLAAVAA